MRGATVRYILPQYVDVIVQDNFDSVILVRRAKDPEVWALPGGLLRSVEDLQNLALREVKRETGFTVAKGKPFNSYVFVSPNGVPCANTTVFVGQGSGVSLAGDGILEVGSFLLSSLPKLLPDHKPILSDFVSFLFNREQPLRGARIVNRSVTNLARANSGSL